MQSKFAWPVTAPRSARTTASSLPIPAARATASSSRKWVATTPAPSLPWCSSTWRRSTSGSRTAPSRPIRLPAAEARSRERVSIMAEQTEDIVGLVESVVRPLVEFPDDLEITSSDAEDGSISSKSRERRRCRQGHRSPGRVIKAIRTLARAAASRTNTHVEVELLD